MIYLISSFVFYLIVLIIVAAGRNVLTLSKIVFTSRTEELTFSYAIGFALMSYLILFIGMCNLLYKEIAILFLIILAFFLRKDIVYINKEILDSIKEFARTNFKFSTLLLVFLIIIIALIICIGALAPSYSNDSMVYHLTDAKYFANTHTIGLIPYNSTNSLWPYLVEMYFVLAILLNMLPLAGLFHFSLMVATAVALYTFSKRFFSEELAVLASTIFILVPGIFMEAVQTYVDLGLVFYTFMAVYAFLVWMEKGQLRWSALSGAMCGLGMSVKYFGIVIPLILGTYFTFGFFRVRGLERKAIFKSFILFFVSAVVTSFIWYLRQYIVMGNPVSPFFYRIFGTGKLTIEVVEAISEKFYHKALGSGLTLKNFFTIPWRLTMLPAEFGGEQLGPIFLAMIPALVLIKGMDRNTKRILIFSSFYFLIWILTYQQLRFLLPVVPFLSIVSAYVLYNLAGTKGVLSKLIWTSLAVYLLFLIALCIYHNVEAIKVVSGLESRESYLARNERSFQISEYMNKNLPHGTKIMVVNEEHTFFIDIDYKRELYYWIYTNYDKKCHNAQEVITFLKSEGFTHILYADAGSPLSEKPQATRLTELMLDDVVRKRYLRLIYKIEQRSKNANGLRYLVYEIKV